MHSYHFGQWKFVFKSFCNVGICFLITNICVLRAVENQAVVKLR